MVDMLANSYTTSKYEAALAFIVVIKFNIRNLLARF